MRFSGWTYAAEFKELIKLLDDDASHASRHPTDAVRRRRWMRFRQPCQDLMSSTGAPIESPQADGTPSSTTSWLNESSSIDSNLQSIQFLNADDDDPFSRTAQKQQTGFRMNIKFTHRGGKDTTKDYQSISLSDINWLVNERDNTKAPTDEILREKTANLEVCTVTNEASSSSYRICTSRNASRKPLMCLCVLKECYGSVMTKKAKKLRINSRNSTNSSHNIKNVEVKTKLWKA